MFNLFGIFSPSPPSPEPIPPTIAAPAPDVVLTADILDMIWPGVPDPALWVAGLDKTFGKFLISNRKRAACFLAQTMYESGGFRTLSEDLDYSAAGLLAEFPHDFTVEEADTFARNPQAIADRVYANRMGDGDEASGDGWTYRGGGLLQLTGRANYEAFGISVDMDVSQAADYVRTPEGACMSAGWFWLSHGLNQLADADEFTEITRRINGGLNGLADRKAVWAKAQAALA